MYPPPLTKPEQDSGGGSGFDDYGGELELHKLDFSRDTDGGGGGGGSGGGGSAAGTLLGKVKTRSVTSLFSLVRLVMQVLLHFACCAHQ